MIRYLFFSLSEAITNLWRSRVLNLLSIGTITLAIFILGSFLLLGHNLRSVSMGWERNLQFHIFLDDDFNDQQQETLSKLLSNQVTVESSEFISKEDAWRRFESEFSSYRDISDALSSNPFPASFRVKLNSDEDTDSIIELRTLIESQPGVEQVSYDRDVVERLAFLGRMVEMAGWLFGAIMIFASVFTISNVLKLTFFARREEVDIMKLVGASRAYIRGPFLIEGFLQGFVGAVLGVLILFLGYVGLAHYLSNHPANLLAELGLVFVPGSWVLSLVTAGCLSGFIGAAFSLNQFLEEHISYQ